MIALLVIATFTLLLVGVVIQSYRAYKRDERAVLRASWEPATTHRDELAPRHRAELGDDDGEGRHG